MQVRGRRPSAQGNHSRADLKYNSTTLSVIFYTTVLLKFGSTNTNRSATGLRLNCCQATHKHTSLLFCIGPHVTADQLADFEPCTFICTFPFIVPPPVKLESVDFSNLSRSAEDWTWRFVLKFPGFSPSLLPLLTTLPSSTQCFVWKHFHLCSATFFLQSKLHNS